MNTMRWSRNDKKMVFGLNGSMKNRGPLKLKKRREKWILRQECCIKGSLCLLVFIYVTLFVQLSILDETMARSVSVSSSVSSSNRNENHHGNGNGNGNGNIDMNIPSHKARIATPESLMKLRKPKQDTTNTAFNDQVNIQHEEHSIIHDQFQSKNTLEKFVLKAYLEQVNEIEMYKTVPLPSNRSTAQPHLLQVKHYQSAQEWNCSQSFASQFPIDDYPGKIDAFLPWIHDVFPTDDYKAIQLVAQNHRRCNTGTTQDENNKLKHYKPQATLFQQVAVKTLQKENPLSSALSDTADSKDDNPRDEPRFQLVNHDDADPEGLATRFICRFSSPDYLNIPTMTTLSQFNVDYEWAAFRKSNKFMFSEEGRDNKSIYTSQLLFQCPIPKPYQSILQQEEQQQQQQSAAPDHPLFFLDVVPIRTPLRLGPSNAFLKPRYAHFRHKTMGFNATIMYGPEHIVPPIANSGRWEHIPICQTTKREFPKQKSHRNNAAGEKDSPSISLRPPLPSSSALKPSSTIDSENQLRHRLAICTWASTGYHTRGQRFQIDDGIRRMREWIHFHMSVGVEHFYIYDNSRSHRDNKSTLRPIQEMFPDHVTILEWPAQVCNNNPNNVDSCGERSSQYAAEASCRLRFGPYVKWMAGIDIDEYLVPMGNFTTLVPLLDKMDSEGLKIMNFPSWRAWPRKDLIEPPEEIHNSKQCWSPHPCFQLKVPVNRTVLQTYNCDRQRGTKKQQMPAEKQIYQPSYVKMHFIHYSTITTLSEMNKEEWAEHFDHNLGFQWPMTKDLNSRFSDELNEGTMLHTKAMARQDTAGWKIVCHYTYNDTRGTCRIGNPYPEGAYEQNVTYDSDGWKYNCFVNEKIENYFVPRLEKSMEGTKAQFEALS